MIFFNISQNNILNQISDFLNKNSIKCETAETPSHLYKTDERSAFICFYDPYMDNHSRYQSVIAEVIENCNKNNIELIYLDTTHVYGLTEKTSVNEMDIHKPISEIGHIRETAYKQITESSGLKYTILRFPDFLGRNCNLFFNDFFNVKSNFIRWIGLTHINHEFLLASDACKVIQRFIENESHIYNEYNISGAKFTIEQIAAQIDMQYNIPVKIAPYSKLKLFLSSTLSKDKGTAINQRALLQSGYLYSKPVFLNGESFQEEMGFGINKNLENMLSEIMDKKI